MQGIYTYITETNHVPREHRVTATLVLLFMVLISLVTALTSLYLYVITFRSTCAVPNMAVFCSFLTSCFPGMLLTCQHGVVLNDGCPEWNPSLHGTISPIVPLCDMAKQHHHMLLAVLENRFVHYDLVQLQFLSRSVGLLS